MTLVLRELRDGDEAELLRIHRTPEVARWWGEPDEGFPWSDAPECERRVIEHDARVVGLLELHEEPTPTYRHAAIDLFVDPAVRGRGIGPAAIALLLRELFDERGHHRVTIDPALENAAAIRAYEKVGFRRVGVMREYERDADGRGWHDSLLMELLAGEERLAGAEPSATAKPTAAAPPRRCSMAAVIVVVARLRIEPEQRERFVQAASELCARTREEDGCISYRVHGDLERPDRYVFVEEWRDDDALQRHFTQPHMAAFNRALGPLLSEPAEVEFHTIASSRRLDPERGVVAVER